MSDIHARAKRGIKLLMGRQVLLQILTFGGGIVLARVLDPAQFGLYAIATFLVGAFALFGDFGLSPSFIQRKEELTEQDLRVGFTLQQIITTLIVGTLFLAAPWLARLYPKAPPETVWLVRTLAFSLYLTSWRSMSALQLERHLRYDRLAWIEVTETLSFQSLAVGLALAGFGVWSFVWATMLRSVLGAALVFSAAPWKVRFGLDREIAHAVLKFGVPFQLQTVINSVGNFVMPIMVGSLIGPQAVGFLTWASSNGRKPLMLVDSIVRVAFPHFARLQQDRAEVEETLRRYLTYLLLLAGLWCSLLLAAGSDLVRIIYTAKWLPAVPALLIFSLALYADIISWLVTVTLNSLNLVKYATRVYVLRSATNIVLTVGLVLAFGLIGVPIAYFISVNITAFWLLGGLGQGTARRVLLPLTWISVPVAASAALGLAAHGLISNAWLRIILECFLTAGAYGLAVWNAAPRWLQVKARTKVSRIVSKSVGIAITEGVNPVS